MKESDFCSSAKKLRKLDSNTREKLGLSVPSGSILEDDVPSKFNPNPCTAINKSTSRLPFSDLTNKTIPSVSQKAQIELNPNKIHVRRESGKFFRTPTSSKSSITVNGSYNSKKKQFTVDGDNINLASIEASLLSGQMRTRKQRKTDPNVFYVSRSISFEQDISNTEYDTTDIDFDDTSVEDVDLSSFTVPQGYVSLGPPTEFCSKCKAVMWKEERSNKHVKKGPAKFSVCCGQGTIKLPPTPVTPEYLLDLYNHPKKGPAFKRNIRLYNYMFAFTSMGGKNRLKWFKVDDDQGVDVDVVEGLVQMLDSTNQLVKKFRKARDRFRNDPVQDLTIRLKVHRSESGRPNNIGPSNEVAAIMVGDIDTTCGERDIILQKTNNDLERITSVHPKLMALQYPLLFPLGEDGYHNEIPYVDSETQKKKKRKRITMKEYYAYKLQVRTRESLHVHLAGRLYQQYVVDAFSCVEQARLWWLRTHQQNLRSDLYSSVAKKLVNGETITSNVGKGFILPANFLGSKRYMQQNFQDALAVCHSVGHPNIFLTMTCNPLWDEILQMMKHLPGCSPQDSPDIISRVFHLKLEQLLDDIKKTVFLLNFKKEVYLTYCSETYFDQSGFPIYRRRKTGITVAKGKCELDNAWVVPYNRDLLVKYQCHMNVEICCHARSLKYLFKYCLKGHDRATIEITSRIADKDIYDETPVDEINAYFDGHYICASKAAYQIFGYPIHCRSISVLRLAFHLPSERICTFSESEVLAKVVRREKNKHSQLEAFFHLNSKDPKARNYTYDQIPEHYVWNEVDRLWTLRKKGRQIGRLLYTHHTAGELWYLRLLLSNIRGPTSFQSLKTVNGIQYRTFKDACKIYGLLDDDNEWHFVLEYCAISGLPCQIRQLFVYIIVNCQVSDLTILWEKH
ncbi:uncharacterized protein LOC141674853 [Apium graveolens]|uniref:uncharacterized protein LOC141674853 n=1 Tax=Apium graveolens TaxID=4045 RepID=UPI003D7B0FBE